MQADLHDMLSAIPVLEVNIDHSAPAAPRDPRAPSSTGEATQARRVMESHCDDTAALLRGLLTDHADRRPGDPMRLPTRNPRLLSLEHLKDLIGNGEVDTVVIAFTDMQGRLQGKRLHAAYFLDVVVEQGAEGCNYLLGVDVDMNTVDGYAMTSWEKGYGDMEFVLDYDTIRLLPHLPATVMIQCDLVLADHAPVEPSPRTILKKQLARAADAGYVALAGTELEFIVFDDTYESAWNTGYRDLTPEQPVQRRLLHPRYDAGRAAAARHPQLDARRRA